MACFHVIRTSEPLLPYPHCFPSVDCRLVSLSLWRRRCGCHSNGIFDWSKKGAPTTCRWLFEIAESDLKRSEMLPATSTEQLQDLTGFSSRECYADSVTALLPVSTPPFWRLRNCAVILETLLTSTKKA